MLTEPPPTRSLKFEKDRRGLWSNILFVRPSGCYADHAVRSPLVAIGSDAGLRKSSVQSISQLRFMKKR